MKTSINAAKVISYFLIVGALFSFIGGITSAIPGDPESTQYVWFGLAGFFLMIASASVLSMIAGIAKSSMSMAADMKEMSEVFKAMNQHRASSASQPPAPASPRAVH